MKILPPNGKPGNVWSFVPRNIGLMRAWSCEECGSLVLPDDLERHCAWHDWILSLANQT